MTDQDTTPVRDDVRLECRDQVAYVTIDRPKVLNALDASATARLEQIWTRIEADPDLRCVVLTGGGERAFCTGADMSVEGVGKSGLDYWASLEPDGFGAISLR
ncbi:MAG TPA: enoyl-CoA hydratase-related protein, partial [Marmoricola sp.]